jgi:tetrahydromethanopterin S-methyltransferase subunit G
VTSLQREYHARVEIIQPSTAARPVRADVDRDRGMLVGAVVGLTMLVVLQAFIAAAYQLATRGEGALLAPIEFAGFTQLMYVAPTVLLFVNRRCPKMATGAALVAAAVFFVNVVYVILW